MVKNSSQTYEKDAIPKKSENFSEWYTKVILRSELADYAPTKGCMVIRPYGYAIWERVQQLFDPVIKASGAKNAYFPLLIPEKLLKREKDHVKGFAPEAAVVTIGGGEKLAEPLIVRPTSEAIMYAMYAKWIHSWRDLPLKINQWNNVVRWEKRTYLFLRTTEFLWQEGHTAHATHDEAMEEVLRALTAYTDLYRNSFAIDGIEGIKSDSEKFAGAAATYTYEMLMPDGKALQGCTSHDLGQNFAKAFEIGFRDENGEMQMPWQTSWGLTTRSIGALIMSHGDDQGLQIPPALAPVQIIIVPIWKSDADSKRVLDAAERLRATLSSRFRVEVDARDNQSPGWKFNEWELKGVPLRIELGVREIEKETITFARRDSGKRDSVPLDNLVARITAELDDIQRAMLEKSRSYLRENTRDAKDYAEFKKIMRTTKGFIRAFWCEDADCEKKIKEETKATTRCLPLGETQSPKSPSSAVALLRRTGKVQNGTCVQCGGKAKHRWIFAQAY